MNNDKVIAHLEELKKRHRELDEEITRLTAHHISAELRQMKTQKLWLKDEIYRLTRELSLDAANDN